MVIMAGKKNRDKVAAMAGVSSATVSRVYNNPDRVSPSKKDAVLKAAAALGYSPDKSASALRRKGTGQISLVSIEKRDRPWYWGDFPGAKWFFTDALQGILPVVDRSMYRLNIKTLKTAEEAGVLDWEKECDGALFFDIDDEREAAAIADLPIPAVISHHTLPFSDNNCCFTDNAAGGSIAADALKAGGYSKPVYISYLPDMISPNRERYHGFSRAWKNDTGRDVPLQLTDPGKEGGYSAMNALIPDLQKGKMDSVADVNDMVAIGVIQCLQDRGINPGRDIGIIGYDNMPFNYVLPFRLATIDLQPSKIYEEALIMLQELIRDPDQGPLKKVILPQFIPGDSL